MLAEYAPDPDEIGLKTTLGGDLEMESIDLFALFGLLTEWFGPEVNFAEYLAHLELDAIIGLSVGDLVTYVVQVLRPHTGSGG
ncbi:acyl carrier protein [Streptomyces sp. NPDC020800]|uniref:acyl carrier protein n=1 Tax=Streptomyces sp. NPDC020800 TaxID=3365092 RepID=UPI0037AD03E5